MAGRLGTTDDDIIADINITPFVDIILVVLIIFMVTATTIVRASIQVELPDAATGAASETLSVGISLFDDGTIAVDGAPATEAELRERLAAATQQSDDVVCLIAADKGVAHGRVVWVMDVVRSQGISKFAIEIDPASTIAPIAPDVRTGTTSD